MKLFNVFLAIFLFYSCSFDNKSGIWKDEDALTKKIKNTDDFVDLNKILNDNYFNKTVNLDKNFSFKLSKKKNNNSWYDPYYDETNNSENFFVNSLENEIFSSRKLSRNKKSKFTFFSGENLIINDEKGNIIIYSTRDYKYRINLIFIKKNLKM